mmetsp:Transcript_2607/g.5610  ORF Transcript_2607/g.5610 Transcript_2607/m.5610 type:complete len:214 (-) Transcript_2607:1146-1787(-)
MVRPMVLCPCCGCSTTRPGMWIRGEARGRVRLPRTLSLGMPFWTCVRTMVMRWNAPAICSMRFGSLIFSWNVCNRMETGRSCVPMSARGSIRAGEMSSRPYMKSTRRRVGVAKLSRRSSFGLPFWIRRWRRGRHTCCTRITATPSPIRRIWVPSSAPTSVPKLSSTRLRMRLRYATLPPSVCPNSSLQPITLEERAVLIWTSSSTLPRWLPRI